MRSNDAAVLARYEPWQYLQANQRSKSTDATRFVEGLAEIYFYSYSKFVTGAEKVLYLILYIIQ